MKFILTIQFGNEAMLTYADVSKALEVTSKRLAHGRVAEPLVEESAPVRDENGNKVGEWEIFGDDATVAPFGNTVGK